MTKRSQHTLHRLDHIKGITLEQLINIQQSVN